MGPLKAIFLNASTIQSIYDTVGSMGVAPFLLLNGPNVLKILTKQALVALFCCLIKKVSVFLTKKLSYFRRTFPIEL